MTANVYIDIAAGNHNIVLMARWTDAANQMLAVWFPNTSTITLYAGSGGSFPVVGTIGGQSIPYETDFQVGLTVGSDNIARAFIDGDEKISGDASSVPESDIVGLESTSHSCLHKDFYVAAAS